MCWPERKRVGTGRIDARAIFSGDERADGEATGENDTSDLPFPAAIDHACQAHELKCQTGNWIMRVASGRPPACPAFFRPCSRINNHSKTNGSPHGEASTGSSRYRPRVRAHVTGLSRHRQTEPVRMGCGLMTFDTVPGWGLGADGKSVLGPTHGGVVIDKSGNIYTSAHAGVFVFSPDGKVIRKFPRGQVFRYS